MRFLGCHLQVRTQPISGAGGGACGLTWRPQLLPCSLVWEPRRTTEFPGTSARLQPDLTRPCPTAPELSVCSAPARPAMGARCRSFSALLLLLLLQVCGGSRLGPHDQLRCVFFFFFCRLRSCFPSSKKVGIPRARSPRALRGAGLSAVE